MALIFRQFFESESSTYTYLLADSETAEALLIDSVVETMERDLRFINEMGLKLKFLVETHVHADHITASGAIRQRTGALIVVGKAAGVETADIQLQDGDSIEIGDYRLKALSTPGHTAGCTSYFLSPYVFTGDALLIRGCGRTDFQGGSSETLFRSVRERIFTLPGDVLVCPAHDYNGCTLSSIKEEKEHNPRLKISKSLQEFRDLMENLNLADPKKMDVAVPANLVSGKI